MTPAQAREELMRRALAADRLRVWLAGAAHVALAWERADDGTMTARGPTDEEIVKLATHASDLPRVEVEAALAVLRRIGGAT